MLFRHAPGCLDPLDTVFAGEQAESISAQVERRNPLTCVIEPHMRGAYAGRGGVIIDADSVAEWLRLSTIADERATAVAHPNIEPGEAAVRFGLS